MSNPILDAARAERDKSQKQMEKLLEKPAKAARALTDDEAADFEKYAERIKKLDGQIEGLAAEDERRSKAEAAVAVAAKPATLPAGEGVIRSEPGIYRPDAVTMLGEPSYLRDLAAFMVPGASAKIHPKEARARLMQNWKEWQREADHGNDKTARRIVDEVRRWTPDLISRVDPEFRTNPNTTAGTGGEFVPPLWLMQQYAPFQRPGRVFADRCRSFPLPPGIDVINVPRITGGSSTAIQATQGTGVSSTDITTSSASSNVNTIAGQEDISLQLLEQSPLSMDQVVFTDLSADYDKQLDLQVISGTGSSGQHTGVLNVSGASSPTVSQASQVTCGSTVFFDASTANTQVRSIIKGVNQVETLLFRPPTAVWAHPRRTNSWGYAADGNNRPIFVQAPYSPWNAVGVNESSPVVQGVAGTLYGLPVIKDANMSTTMNSFTTTGGSADAVVVLSEPDQWLWEGTLRMRALPEILSGTLQIRFQVYAYSAFMATRFPNSIAVIAGNTGMAAPGF